MMKKNRFFLLMILFWASVLPAAHITDRLLVGVYDQPRPDAELLKLVASGAPLDVLDEKAGFNKVRLADGQEGWVEKTYVTEEKLAKAILLETQAKIAVLKGQLSECKKSQPSVTTGLPNKQEQDEIAKLQQEIVLLKKRMRDVATILSLAVNDSVENVGQESIKNETEAESDESQLQRYWPWVAMFITLLLGFAGGVAFIDRKVRKRYGGFRL